jgi:hypothetical protein
MANPVLITTDRVGRLQQEFATDEMGFQVKLHGSNPERLMSALGQKRTSDCVRAMSALPPKADIETQSRDVRFVPFADQVHRNKVVPYSITSSAVVSSVAGTVTPSMRAVLRLMTSSKRVGCSTGRSDGNDPLKILSTRLAARR